MGRGMWLKPAVMTAILGFAFPLGAQQETTSLETVVVTADRVGEMKREVTANISVIGEEVIKRSSARDLGDLLSQQGFQISKTQGFLTGVSLRGFSSDAHGFELGGRVLFLINGRRSMTGNISKIPTSNVERVEIIRGPTATQYGASAMGGVINVITKTGGQDVLSGSVQTGLGSYDYWDTIISLGGEKNGFDYFINYDYSTRGDYTTGNGERYRGSGWNSKNSGSLDLGYTFDQHRLGISANFFDANLDYPGKWGANNIREGDRTNKSVELNYKGGTEDETWLWSGRFSVGKDDELYLTPSTGRVSHYWTDAQQGGGQVTYNGEMFRLTTGVDYVYYDMTQTWAPLKSDNRNLAGFMLGKLRLMDERLIFSAGARYDHYRVRVKSSDERGSASDHNFSPSVGVAYLPTDWLKLRANFAEAFLMPTARQLASNGDTYVGNPNLKPETSRTWEAGFDIAYNPVNFSFTFFHTDSEDLISATGRASDGRRFHVNIGEAVREGLEFEFSSDLGYLIDEGYTLRPYANLNFMTKYRDKITGRRLGDINDFTAGYGVLFGTPEDDFTAALKLSYFGEEIYRVTAGDTVYGQFTVADLTAQKKLFDFADKGNLTLRVEVNNLFDKQYEYTPEYPNPGRNFYVGLIYGF